MKEYKEIYYEFLNNSYSGDKEYQDILFSLFFFYQLRKKSKILEK